MSGCRFIVFVTCSFLVYGTHGENTDVTDHVITDTRTVLLAVSDLTQQIEDLMKDRLDDHDKILSLESKCEKLLEENARLNKRVEHLESLPQNDDQHISPASPSPVDGGRQRVVRTQIPDNRNISDGSDIPDTTPYMVSVPEQNNGINTDVHSGQGKGGSARRIVQSSGRRIRSEHSLPGASLRFAASTNVAFSAYLSHYIADPGDDYVFKFDRVLTNIGNAYSPVTGAFTCPMSGTYVFMWSVGMTNTGFVYSSLMKNGVSVGWSVTVDDHYSSMVTQTSVLMLSADDVITVKLGGHTESPGLRDRHTSFNGFILY